MYQQYWGLRNSPFRGGLDTSLFYATANHDEALARLHFLVEERRRLGLLSGVSGIGKSLLLEVFATQVRETGGEVARVSLMGRAPLEILWDLAAQFGLNPPQGAGMPVLWRCLGDHFVAQRYLQTSTVVLLDDVDHWHTEVSELVLRLAQVDIHAQSRLTLVLASAECSRLPSRLLQLAELAVELEPWQAPETAGYLSVAVQQPDRRGRTLFSPAAVSRLHELSGGIPQRIKQLAELSLVAGAVFELAEVDAATVDGAFQELGVVV